MSRPCAPTARANKGGEQRIVRSAQRPRELMAILTITERWISLKTYRCTRGSPATPASPKRLSLDERVFLYMWIRMSVRMKVDDA